MKQAWAIHEDYIDIDGKHYPRLLGWLCWQWTDPKRPACFGGYTTAVFESREAARTAKNSLCRKRTKVVAVNVTVAPSDPEATMPSPDRAQNNEQERQ